MESIFSRPRFTSRLNKYCLSTKWKPGGCTHWSADFIAHSKVKATLLIHRVVDARKFRKLRPVVFEGVIQEAVICAVIWNRSDTDVKHWTETQYCHEDFKISLEIKLWPGGFIYLNSREKQAFTSFSVFACALLS